MKLYAIGENIFSGSLGFVFVVLLTQEDWFFQLNIKERPSSDREFSVLVCCSLPFVLLFGEAKFTVAVILTVLGFS